MTSAIHSPGACVGVRRLRTYFEKEFTSALDVECVGRTAFVSTSPETELSTGVNGAVHDAMWRGHGGWEMTLMPVLFAGFGWLIDGWLGTTPIFIVVLAIVGFAGSVANQYFQYRYRMEQANAERLAIRNERPAPTLLATEKRHDRESAIAEAGS